MRNLFFCVMMTGLFAACATSGQSVAERSAQASLTAQTVRKLLADKYFTIDVDFIVPQRYASRHVSSGHGIHVSGDSLYSFLPYIGRSNSMPYGGGNGLNFRGLVENYIENRKNKDATTVEFSVMTAEDKFRYVLVVYDNGNACINVFSSGRDVVRFTGKMKF